MKNTNIIIVGLIATIPRIKTLIKKAIPSVGRQTRPLDVIVIISDQDEINTETMQIIKNLTSNISVYQARNTGQPGAAGSWNSGIRFIAEHWPQCYVAILDDDDEWDPDHIATCLSVVHNKNLPDVVVSGLRIRMDSIDLPRDPPLAFALDDFLKGNPGWQGSNTFIRLDTLLRAGSFTEGLSSCNDRDLAVRVLRLPLVEIAFTGKHTATWHIDSSIDQLSRRGSLEKRKGLAKFFQLHSHLMDQHTKSQFFERANTFFAITEVEILATIFENYNV